MERLPTPSYASEALLAYVILGKALTEKYVPFDTSTEAMHDQATQGAARRAGESSMVGWLSGPKGLDSGSYGHFTPLSRA
jgi:hypothetical protein